MTTSSSRVPIRVFVIDDEQHLQGILTKMDLVDHLTGSVEANA